MELLAQTAVLLGHPQIGSLVIWSPGITGGWREFGLTLLKCGHLWLLLLLLCLCRCPQPLTWLKLSPLTQWKCLSLSLYLYMGVWVCMLKMHIRYLSDNNMSMQAGFACVRSWFMFHCRCMSAQACIQVKLMSWIKIHLTAYSMVLDDNPSAK